MSSAMGQLEISSRFPFKSITRNLTGIPFPVSSDAGNATVTANQAPQAQAATVAPISQSTLDPETGVDSDYWPAPADPADPVVAQIQGG